MVIKTCSTLAIEAEAGTKIYWCSCGFSQTMPLYHHSHRELSDKKSVKFIAEETKTLYLCGCIGTQTLPYCDDSNNCGEI